MTMPNPLQLHLFDAKPDPALIPPERRRRLLTLTGVLLQEAVQNEAPIEESSQVTETPDE